MTDYDYNTIRDYMDAHPEEELKVVAAKLDIPTKVVWRVFQVDARKENPNYASKSKTSQILKYMQAHPRSSTHRVSEAVGASRALVTDTRSLWRDLLADPATAPHYAPAKPNRQTAAKPVAPPEDDTVWPNSPVLVEAFKEVAYRATCGRQAHVSSVDAVLAERGKDYGDYASKAQFIQGVKYLMRASPSWEAMDADMRESMEMIAHKMGRVLYGDSTHKDNFVDIAGYAKLVADRL